ncbi:hypothetical protein [Enterococcus wangshanyuanii]|nr:hypothetical protein [Enterococcus wangshanyuanii]
MKKLKKVDKKRGLKMNIKSCLFSVLLCLGLLLSGCSTRLTEGIVQKKDYSPAYITAVPMMIGETMTVIPQTYSASYRLLIDGTVENEHISEWVSVTPSEYEAISVGDHWKK